MIHGIGTDLVGIARCTALLQRRPQIVEALLTPEEQAACRASPQPGRVLARHIAAKEALAKALGSGLRPPVAFQSIEVIVEDPPRFLFSGPLANHVDRHQLGCHLSLSDHGSHVVACVIATTGG